MMKYGTFHFIKVKKNVVFNEFFLFFIFFN